MTQATIPTVQLNNGVEMPVLGFGVFQIPPEQTEQAVARRARGRLPLDRHGRSYENEEAVGNAIKASGVPREELFVTTKLWIGPGRGEGAGARSSVAAAARLDYLDLYLIHQPFGDYYGSWRAMEELYREGLARAIGVTNFHPDRVMDLIAHNEVAPAVNQIETHPFHQQVDEQEFLREHGVQIESWGPFAEGKNNIFSDRR